MSASPLHPPPRAEPPTHSSERPELGGGTNCDSCIHCRSGRPRVQMDVLFPPVTLGFGGETPRSGPRSEDRRHSTIPQPAISGFDNTTKFRTKTQTAYLKLRINTSTGRDFRPHADKCYLFRHTARGTGEISTCVQFVHGIIVSGFAKHVLAINPKFHASSLLCEDVPNRRASVWRWRDGMPLLWFKHQARRCPFFYAPSFLARPLPTLQ